jgi:hypothetical protein
MLVSFWFWFYAAAAMIAWSTADQSEGTPQV